LLKSRQQFGPPTLTYEVFSFEDHPTSTRSPPAYVNALSLCLCWFSVFFLSSSTSQVGPSPKNPVLELPLASDPFSTPEARGQRFLTFCCPGAENSFSQLSYRRPCLRSHGDCECRGSSPSRCGVARQMTSLLFSFLNWAWFASSSALPSSCFLSEFSVPFMPFRIAAAMVSDSPASLRAWLHGDRVSSLEYSDAGDLPVAHVACRKLRLRLLSIQNASSAPRGDLSSSFFC